MKTYSSTVIFSMLFSVIYTACFYTGYAPFKYYPLVGEFHMADQPKVSGPPISWYGWVVTAFVVSAVVALIVPRRWSDRLSPTIAWLVPTIVLAAVLIYEKRWFV